ncbi:fluoride efflux transporter CrcB [Paenibacillus sp. 1P07SE]|uniref:fluoride efflux transporter CrcB n=1 Tax=Paenibacillus sp. 1P07SE TaxID=3132209 RepID=UPI0039A61019
MSIFLLALGGGLGAVARYVLGLAIMRRYPHPPLPAAMLTVNLIGALGLGLFWGSYVQHLFVDAYADKWFLGIAVGFFGAFTTFSTFSMEAMELIREREYKTALAYIALSIFGSILTFALGYLAGMAMVHKQ